MELQLCHNPDIKGKIDRAWGVSQNKHKKKDAATAPPDPTDPYSQDNLQLVPIGQDSSRKRYWVADSTCYSPSFVMLHIRICVYLLADPPYLFLNSHYPVGTAG